jgi:hypothetical protein
MPKTMRLRTPSVSTLQRIVAACGIIIGAGLTLFELFAATYLVIATAIVVGVIWPIVGGKRRNMPLKKQISLVAIITVGFWVFTTSALKFADSSGVEAGGGAPSLVTVSPSGREMSTRELMLHGMLATLSFAAIAAGMALRERKTSRRRRGREKALQESAGPYQAHTLD